MNKIIKQLPLRNTTLQVLLALIAVIVLWHVFNSCFTALGLIAVLLFFIAKWLMAKYGYNSIIATMALGLYGILCLLTLHHYIYPPKSVFSALDHHALRLDGIAISHPQGFVLAGNNDNAFFDMEEMQGTLSIVDTIGDSVVVMGQGFTRPIYMAKYDSEEINNVLELKTPSHYINFMDGDSISFVSRAGVVRTLKLYEKHRNAEILSLHHRHAHDSTVYIWNGDTLSERRFLNQSLALQEITFGAFNAELIDSISFEELSDSIYLAGINLIRPHINTQAKVDNRYELSQHTYALEFQHQVFDSNGINEDMMLDQVRVGQRIYSVRDMMNSRWLDTIPVGKDHTWVIGSGQAKTRHVYFEKSNGTLLLKYRMPIYHKLSVQDDSPSTTSLLATTIEGYERSVPNDIVLFDIFHRSGNRNNLPIGYYLSYSDGPTTTRVHFTLSRNDIARSDMVDVTPGKPIDGVCTRDGQVGYLLQIEDFTVTTPSPANNLFLYLTIAIIFLIVIQNIGQVTVVEARRANSIRDGISMYSNAEFFAYMFILFILSVRLFLLWRTSVFPPLAIKSSGYFYMWRNQSNFAVTIICSCIFGILLLAWKWYIIYKNDKRISNSKAIIIILIMMLICGIVYMWRNQSNFVVTIICSCIFGSLLLLIWKLYIIYKNYKSNHERISDSTAKKIILSMMLICGILAFGFAIAGGRSGKVLLFLVILYFIVQTVICGIKSHRLTDSSLWPFLCSLVNGLIFSVALLIYDPGFGIIFLSFIVAWTVYDLWFCFINGPQRTNDKRISWLLLAVFFLLVMMFGFYKQVFLFYYNHPIISSLIVAVAVLILLILLNSILALNSITERFKRLHLSPLAVALLFALVFGGITLIAHGGVFKDHTRHRVLVHIATPYEILSDIKSQSDERRFFEASLNDWVLQQYNKRSDEVHLIGGDGKGYLKLQPHSIVGALWGAQATDIALARFIIAEHSEYLAIAMVVLAFILFTVSLTLKRYRRSTSNLIIQIPLLLFIQMLLVWMANTDHFIFFGQDFPMVSITSSFSQAYFFVLLLAWFMAVIWETYHCGYLSISNEDTKKVIENSHNEYVKVANVTVLAVLLASIIIGTTSLFSANSQYSFSDDNASAYSIKEIYDEAERKINLINDVFYDYQDSLNRKIDLKADMAPEIHRFYAARHSQIDAILKNKKVLQDTTVETDSYTTRLWNNFMNYGAHNNTSKSIIHVRGGRRPYVMLALKRRFMDTNLPVSTPKWHGNVTEETQLSSLDTLNQITISRSQGVLCYHIPASWSPDKKTMHLAKLESGRRQLQIEGCPGVLTNRGQNSAIRLFEYDVAHGNEMLMSNLMSCSQYVFAKAVRINNVPTFVYPLGEKFYWAKNFAELVQRKMVNKPKDSLALDMPITIDYELTDTLYNLMGPANHPRCVVVADGDGRVIAIVDRKQERYTINPNRQNEIWALVDRLYMDNTPIEADKYFAPISMLNLQNGPGSSQKPLVWTAVASGMNWDELHELRLIPAIQQPDSAYAKAWYAGQNFRYHKLHSSPSDESGGSVFVGIRNYISNSSNLYNAMMCYLGSLDASLFQNSDFLGPYTDGSTNQLLRHANQNDFSNPRSYPIVQLGSHQYVFTQSITANGVEHGFLTTNMYNLFGLGTTINYGIHQAQTRYPNISTSSHYVYPAQSALLLGQRAASNPYDRMEYAIRSTAVGAKVWEVSPFKMAEMFGRLAVMNQNYLLKFSSEGLPKFQMWQVDNNGYWEGRESLLLGMQDVFINGTAHRSRPNNSSYYIYGKTGTIGEQKGVNDHRLAVIIADRDLSTLRTQEELNQVHYYVVYFAFDRGAAWKCYQICLNTIMNSVSFRQYMSQNNQ